MWSFSTALAYQREFHAERGKSKRPSVAVTQLSPTHGQTVALRLKTLERSSLGSEAFFSQGKGFHLHYTEKFEL